METYDPKNTVLPNSTESRPHLISQTNEGQHKFPTFQSLNIHKKSYLAADNLYVMDFYLILSIWVHWSKVWQILQINNIGKQRTLNDQHIDIESTILQTRTTQ
jgi:hypothetical protein